MVKAELRRHYKQKRTELSATEINVLTEKIMSNLLPLLRDKQHVHLFLPIAGNHEVNGWIIQQEIEKQLPYIQTYASVTNFADGTLKHASLKDGTYIKPGNISIPEPVSTAYVSPLLFDVILVPLFISDSRGYRVGYGGGFYDRFLVECQPDCLKIGLNFFNSIPCISDVNEFDIPLDLLITPEGVIPTF